MSSTETPIQVVLELGTVAEWATAIVALVALVLSAAAFVTSKRSTRRLSFMALEERLVTAEAARGRREVYGVNSARDARRIHRRQPSRWDRLNQAVVLWNKLAQYAEAGLVERELAMGMWGDSVLEAWPHIEHVIRYRRSIGRADKWSTLVRFAKAAGASVSSDLDADAAGR